MKVAGERMPLPRPSPLALEVRESGASNPRAEFIMCYA